MIRLPIISVNIKVNINWEDSSEMIIHLGMNPKKGGSPPKLKIIIIIIMNDIGSKEIIELGILLIIILLFLRRTIRATEIVT